METAIDYYEIGKVRTITASHAKSLFHTSIGTGTERFVCPECGDYVAFVRGNNVKPHFKHAKLNETTKDCERRVNSQPSYTSIHEKLGLPLYLRNYSMNQYELCIGFYKLGYKLLENIAKEHAKINIRPFEMVHSIKRENIYLLNQSNFLPESTTLLKVDYIATKYIIQCSNLKYESQLKEQWGGFVEGILSDGALFTYNEYGGRKIRINDEITTGTEYLYLCKNEHLLLGNESISHSFCGTIVVFNGAKLEELSIYKINFTPQNDQQFWRLIKLCRDCFKVSLVSKSASIVPIWPPTVLNDNHIGCLRKYNNFFLLKDSKNDTVVSSYVGATSTKLSSKVIDKNTKLLEIYVPSSGLALAIHGSYTMLQKSPRNIKSYRNSIRVHDHNNKELDVQKNRILPVEKTIRIFSESRCSILHTHGGIFTQYKLNGSSPLEINNLAQNDEIIEISGGRHHNLLRFNGTSDSNNILVDERIIYNKLTRLNGPYVSPPYWIRKLTIQLRPNSKLRGLLRYYLMLNRIPVEGLKVLKVMSNQRKDGIEDEFISQ